MNKEIKVVSNLKVWCYTELFQLQCMKGSLFRSCSEALLEFEICNYFGRYEVTLVCMKKNGRNGSRNCDM
jgi:hypothetical protein